MGYIRLNRAIHAELNAPHVINAQTVQCMNDGVVYVSLLYTSKGLYIRSVRSLLTPYSRIPHRDFIENFYGRAIEMEGIAEGGEL